VIPKIEIPQRVRAIVRARESGLIVLAAIVGAIGGIVVVAMATGVDLLHALFFGLAPDERLSERKVLDPLHALLVPLVGGLILGYARMLSTRWRQKRAVDPIEANALHGGRMSLRDSLIVAGQHLRYWSRQLRFIRTPITKAPRRGRNQFGSTRGRDSPQPSRQAAVLSGLSDLRFGIPAVARLHNPPGSPMTPSRTEAGTPANMKR
jgi:hypothetical protein